MIEVNPIIPTPPPAIIVRDSSQIRSFETLCSEGVNTRKKSDNAKWTLGDLACEVEVGYGDKAIEKFAARLDEKVERIREYRRVSRAFPKKEDRELGLSYSIYAEAASMPNPKEWAEKALEEEWTVNEIRSAKSYFKDTSKAKVEGRPCIECEAKLPENPIHVKFDGMVASVCSWDCLIEYCKVKRSEEESSNEELLEEELENN